MQFICGLHIYSIRRLNKFNRVSLDFFFLNISYWFKLFKHFFLSWTRYFSMKKVHTHTKSLKTTIFAFGFEARLECFNWLIIFVIAKQSEKHFWYWPTTHFTNIHIVIYKSNAYIFQIKGILSSSNKWAFSHWITTHHEFKMFFFCLNK